MIQLSVVEITKGSNKVANEEIRAKIKTIVDECCQLCGVKLNINSRRFIDFMCQDPTERPWLKDQPLPLLLTNYPDIWTTQEKECYLIGIISGGILSWKHTRSRINSSGVIWPDNGTVRGILATNSFSWNKEKKFPFDYVHLCRNCHKHFKDLPLHIQVTLNSKL